MRTSPHPVVGSARVHPPPAARPDFRLASLPVSSYKVEQCRIHYRGRDFHFVSYDGHPANERRGELAAPPMWYLMGPGRRWPVAPQILGQPAAEVERTLIAWLRGQGVGGP
jgi:hypothetical protein